MANVQKTTPFLVFDGVAEEAATLYVSLFANAKINRVQPGPGGKAMVVVFTLAGQSFLSLNQGGPNFAFNESTSLLVDCEEGWEVDHSWNGLVENGGKET